MKRTVAHLLAWVAILATGCGHEQTATPSMDDLYRDYGIPVRTEAVTLGSLDTTHSFDAILCGVEEATVTAPLSDAIESIDCRVGDTVTEDQIVVRFPTDNPQAQYTQASVARDHARTTLERIERLHAEGGISRQDLDNTRTQYEIAEASFEAVSQVVRVTSPIAGTITQISVRESDDVKAGDPLFTVSRTDRLRATVWAGEDQIGDIVRGQAARAVWRGMMLQGRVEQVDRSLDSDRQAFGVVVEFDNPGERFMSGVNAEVTILGGTGEQIVIVERETLRRNGDAWIAYVAEDSLAIMREVMVGRSYDVDVEILSGLEPGENMVVEGLDIVSDGSKVRVIGD